MYWGGRVLIVPIDSEAAEFLLHCGVSLDFLQLALVAEGQRVGPEDNDPVLMLRALIALASDRARQRRPVSPELSELVALWLDRCAAVTCGPEERKPDTGAAATADEPDTVPVPRRSEGDDLVRDEHRVEHLHEDDVVAREHHIERASSDDGPAPCSPASASPAPVGSNAGGPPSIAQQLVHVALAWAHRGVYAFASRCTTGGIEVGYVDVVPGQGKHRPGRGRHPVVTADALVAALAGPGTALHLVVVVEDFYSNDDSYISPWVPALTAAASVASLTDVRIGRDELFNKCGIPFSLLCEPEGDDMLIEILCASTTVVLDPGAHDLATAVALLVVQERSSPAVGLTEGELDALLELDDHVPAARHTGEYANSHVSAAASTGSPPRGPVSSESKRLTLATAPGSTMLTVSDIVELFQVSRSFVYGLKKLVPHNKFGGLRFRKADIENYLSQVQRRPAAEGIRRRRPGTSVARSHREGEVAPGLTAADLKRRVGF